MRMAMGVALVLAASAIAEDWKAQLSNADPRVRARAAVQLYKAGAADAVPELTECLLDDHYRVKMLAVRALGKAGAAANTAVPELKRLFKDEDIGLRNAAIIAVARIGDFNVLYEAIRRDRKLLYKLGGEYDDVLLALLKHKSWHMRLWIVEMIRKNEHSHPRWIPTLAKLAGEDPAHAVRAEAVLTLVAVDGTEAVPMLLALLRDEDALIRGLALVGIGKHKPLDAAVARSIEPLLSDPVPLIRAHACFALRNSKASMTAIEPLLKDEKEQVRLVVAAVLGQSGRWSEASADALVAAAARAGIDPPYPVTKGRRNLRAGGGRPFEPLRRYPNVDSIARTVVLEAGGKAIPSVVRVLDKERRPHRRCALVHALGHLKAVDALEKYAQDSNESVARRAAACRAQLGASDAKTVEVLVACLDGAAYRERALTGGIDWGGTAPDLIVKIGDPAIPALEARLKELTKTVRRKVGEEPAYEEVTLFNPALDAEIRALLKRIREKR